MWKRFWIFDVLNFFYSRNLGGRKIEAAFVKLVESGCKEKQKSVRNREGFVGENIFADKFECYRYPSSCHILLTVSLSKSIPLYGYQRLLVTYFLAQNKYFDDCLYLIMSPSLLLSLSFPHHLAHSPFLTFYEFSRIIIITFPNQNITFTNSNIDAQVIQRLHYISKLLISS